MQEMVWKSSMNCHFISLITYPPLYLLLSYCFQVKIKDTISPQLHHKTEGKQWAQQDLTSVFSLLPAVSLFDISGIEMPQTGYHKFSRTAAITSLKTNGPHR